MRTFAIIFLIVVSLVFFPELVRMIGLINKVACVVYYRLKARKAAVGLMNLGWSIHQFGGSAGTRIYQLGAYACDIVSNMNPSALASYREMRRQFDLGGEEK